jgi:hypothetical protein
MTRDELRAVFERYDALVRNFGGPDEESLSEVRKIVWRLRQSADGDPYLLEKLGGMQEWAQIGFSTRKFEKFRGVEQVRAFAMGEAQSAESVLLRALELGDR